MEPLDYCSNFLIGGYNSDGSTRLYSLVEEDELLASIRGRIMKKIALINPPFRGVIHRINVFDNMWNTNPTYYKIYRAGGKLYVERLAKE